MPESSETVSLGEESGMIFSLSETVNAFISHEKVSFHDAIKMLDRIKNIDNGWRLVSISEIEKHEKNLMHFLKESYYPFFPTKTEVWVSDLLELETGTINIPKFYFCEVNLSKPRNGSMALHENKCLALFFLGE